MIKRNEFINLMSMKNVSGLGNKRIIQLIEHFGDSSLIFSLKNRDFKPFRFVTKNIMNDLNNTINKNSERFEKVYDYCIGNGIDIFSYFDREYPKKLKSINNPPLVLFLKGNNKLLDSNIIAIVGSRKSSENALKYGFNISKELSEKKYIIVSGGAKGLDTAVHKGTLEANGKTVCILPSGFACLYPKENMELFSYIEKKGLLVSEYLPDKKVDRFSLLERNRITSGISDYVFLVSSTANGGAMAQYKRAFEQGKTIFCPMQYLNMEPFEGIIKLINERKIIPVKNTNGMIAQIKKLEKEHISQLNLSSNFIKDKYSDNCSCRIIPA